MSEQLRVCLVAVALDVAVLLVVIAILAHFLARAAWRERGSIGVIVIVLLTQLVWIAPALLIAGPQRPGAISAYALWFGNWLVAGIALVLLERTAEAIPRQLSDTVRLDGLSGLSTWRHAVFPFVRRDLAIIAVLAVMATLLPFWCLVNQSDASTSVIFQRASSLTENVVVMMAGSLVGALPLIALFFLAKRRR